MNKIHGLFWKIALISVLAAASPGFAADQPANIAAQAPAAAHQNSGEPAKSGAEKAPAEAVAETESMLNLQVPLLSPRFAETPVAMVNDEPILLGALTESLGTLHSQQKEGKEGQAGKKNFQVVLDRLINVSLIQQEAENMGLDEQSEMKQAEEEYAKTTLLEILKQRQLKDLKPDPKLLDQYYKEAVQEWKIKSVKFDKEEDAKELARQLQAGGKFDELADKLIEAGKVEGNKTAEFVKPKNLLPHVAKIVSGMQIGTVSEVVPIGPAFALIRLEEVRYPEGDAEAMAGAREQAMDAAKSKALGEYWNKLKKKYAKIDEKLLRKINFDAPKPGFAKLILDKRPVATVKGGKPITVGEVAVAVKKRFFHGIEEQLKNKNVDRKKFPVLDDLLYKRIYEAEALAQGIDKTPEYKQALKKYHTSLLFSTFIDKVIAPELKVKNDEVKAYYDEHIADFSTPEMIKISALTFTKKAYAEQAVQKLQKGAEFSWLKANAEGQADPKKASYDFVTNLLITKNLPDEVRKAVAGAKSGDVRMLEATDGFYYLLSIPELVPAQASSIESNREEIGKNVYNMKLSKGVEEWAGKLRKAYKVKVFLTDSGATERH